MAFSPVRTLVAPVAPAQTVTDELRGTVQRLAVLIPQIAALFGVTADPKAPSPRPLRPTRPERKVPKGRGPKSGERPPRKQSTDRPDKSTKSDVANIKVDEPAEAPELPPVDTPSEG